MDFHKLDILKEALPYIRRFKKKIFIIKLSGKIVADDAALNSLAEEIALLHQVGFYPVVVHGGGQQMNELAKKLGLEQTIVGGRRVTDKHTLDLAKMVFGGLINTNVASALRGKGVNVVGLSGLDGRIIQAKRRDVKTIYDDKTQQEIQVDFGYVGDILEVDTSLVTLLLEQGYVPVISSLGADDRGEVYNINADTVAVEIATSLQAEKIIFLTDVNGVYLDLKDPASKLDVITASDANEMIRSGKIVGGMVPKIASICHLLDRGVRSAHIVGAFENNALLKEIFTNRGVGTMVTGG